MRRFLAYVLIISGGMLASTSALGQNTTPDHSGSGPADVDPEHARQLETCRSGLLDPEARDPDRRRWADLLLGYDTPPARELVAELMRGSDRPNVQRTLCQAIGDKARVAPDRIDLSFAEPLLTLLGSDVDILRSAAARTLADFPGADVPERLGKIAGDVDELPAKRLAAVDALAPNTHRRNVVGQLIPLLSDSAPQIVERTAAALAPAARGNFGTDVKRWSEWWSDRSRWREEDWLAEQLDIYRRRARRLTDDFDAYREDVRQTVGAIETQSRSFQHELFRLLPVEQRDARLVEWLDSALPLTNGTALAIIQARIADEGKRPEGEVLAALLRLLRSATGDTQRRVLQIVQELNAPEVVDAILSLLDREREPESRHAIFAAIGKLNNPRAIPALIREIADDQAPRLCVREAAIALGNIAGRGGDQLDVNGAITPLKQRYASLGTEANGLRAAIVSAMAGLSRQEFAPELLESVESDDATILQPALRGLLRLSDASKLPRFRSLAAHSDPHVRLAAVQGVAEMGSDESDLETLLGRLNPGIESSEPVREAAWRGFREFMDRRPVVERINAAGRLRDMPILEVQYLTALADGLAQSSASPPEAATILDRLAVSLAGEGKVAEAADRWQQLLDAGVPPGGAGDLLVPALRWLEMGLRSPGDGTLEEALKRIVALAGDDSGKERVTSTVRRFLEAPEFGSDAALASQALAVLRAHGLDDWNEMLDRAAGLIGPTGAPDGEP